MKKSLVQLAIKQSFFGWFWVSDSSPHFNNYIYKERYFFKEIALTFANMQYYKFFSFSEQEHSLK